MSWTYDDDFNEAAYKWDKLPDSAAKNKAAAQMLKRYLSMREHDCGWSNLPHVERPEIQRYPVRPPIPKVLR